MDTSWNSLTSLEKLNIFSYIGFRYSSYWTISKNNTPQNNDCVHLKSSLATIAKFCHGIITLTWHILNKINENDEIEAMLESLTDLSIDDMLDIANRDNLLIGRFEVCAAPPRIIRDILSMVTINHKIISEINSGNHLGLVRHSKVVNELELLFLLYSTARLICLKLKHKFTIEEVLSNENILTIPGISYFNVSIEMANYNRPLDHAFYKTLHMRYWFSYNHLPVAENIFAKLILNKESFNPESWISFRNTTLQITNNLNKKLCNNTNRHINSVTKITTQDFEVFFGTDPASSIG
ncbi:hypothetical protein QWI17_09165 [Gilvimarinus sp. SDUM040013]|uniref:Uncharacterized protein n=1 Tax=Gilvimarinus gilvus TaxID=3058038 RepID=A0ABU4S3L6_9GAMM|nr:hypothetical protein [Gilvimarinus sp. SDUM040013]MDO3386004.1 hypothetical protein [Gilvimarinus sp. SDUM040013]MDX6850458.1 hypothetical protein [Gilvimarinus sp. SDUM040013]